MKRFTCFLAILAILSISSCDFLKSDNDTSRKGVLIYVDTNNNIISDNLYLNSTKELVTFDVSEDEKWKYITELSVSPDAKQLVYVRRKYEPETFNEWPTANSGDIYGAPAYTDAQIYLMDIITKKITPLSGKLVEPPFYPKELEALKGKAPSENEMVIGSEPAWSPDGSKIAFVKTSFESIGAKDVYIYDFSTSEIKPVAYDNNYHVNPQWAGTNNEIVYETNEGLNPEKRNNMANFRNYITDLEGKQNRFFSSKRGLVVTSENTLEIVSGTEGLINRYNVEFDTNNPLYLSDQLGAGVYYSPSKVAGTNGSFTVIIEAFYSVVSNNSENTATEWDSAIGVYDTNSGEINILRTYDGFRPAAHVHYFEVPRVMRLAY